MKALIAAAVFFGFAASASAETLTDGWKVN